jgi:uncharacterized membrane protein affecting hemolysin expression
VNRPTPVKTDNFFLLIFRALRHRRVPIALRIASHNVILVALALVIYACVMGLQFKQAMHEQADALGESLTTQTATSATELLVSNDILSLNVLLNNLTKNPLVAHAPSTAWTTASSPKPVSAPNSLLGEAEGMYQSKITFQDVTAGQLRISLDMEQFQQPMTISLQSMGILSAILLALALALSLRLGRLSPRRCCNCASGCATSTNTPRPPTARTKSATWPASCTPASPRSLRRPSPSRNPSSKKRTSRVRSAQPA